MDEAQRIEAFYKKHGKAPPKKFDHGTEQEIRDNAIRLRPNTWRLEGNQLIGQTEMGPLRQTIPTDVILVKTSEDGLPVFKKIELS